MNQKNIEIYYRELVTFRDPETSQLQTQFASEDFLANCRLAVLTRIGQSGFNSRKKYQRKNPSIG
jgi:hypothetical protein